MVSEFAGVTAPHVSCCGLAMVVAASSLARHDREKAPVTTAGDGLLFIGIVRKVTPGAVDRKEKAKRSVTWLAL